MIKRVAVRACATATLVAAALLLSIGEARAQPHSMRVHDITDFLPSDSNDTGVPAGFPGPDLAAAGVLGFAEGESRACAFSFADALSRPFSVVRIELLGDGADAYELSVGGVDSAVHPAVALQPALLSVEAILSESGLIGDFSVRALRDADSVAPSSAALRISHVSGDAIANLPLQFALTTTEPPADVVLVGADGRALTAVTLAESTPSSAFHAELRERDSEVSLINAEDVAVQIAIVGLAGVSFVDSSAPTRTLTIAANTTRSASFRLIAAADADEVSESGTLALLARSGGAGSPLAADATASVAVSVEDAFAAPFVLDFDGNGTLNIVDGLIMSGVSSRVLSYGASLPPGLTLSQFFEPNAPPGTLDPSNPRNADLFNVAGAAIPAVIADKAKRDSIVVTVSLMFHNYFDDLDLDGNGALNLVDGLSWFGVPGGLSNYQDLLPPGVSLSQFFESDGTLDPSNPRNADLFNVAGAAIPAVIADKAKRDSIVVKVVEAYLRAGHSFFSD